MSPRERAFAELVFAAITAPPGPVDGATFWLHLERDGAPTLLPGLRVMLRVVEWAPRLDPRYGRRFSALGAEEREGWLASLERHPRAPWRSLVGTLKVLACLWAYDDPAARRAAGVAP